MAIVTLILAFLACGVSFLAPYWLVNRSVGIRMTDTSYGLWARCGGVLENIGSAIGGDDDQSLEEQLKKCHWFFQNNFNWQKSLPDWWYACQGLSGFGILLMVMTLPTGCGALCCCSRGLTTFTGSSLLFSGLLQGVSLGVWGYFSHEDYKVTPFTGLSDGGYMNWGYYVGIGGVLLAWLSGMFFLCSRRSYAYHQIPQKA